MGSRRREGGGRDRCPFVTLILILRSCAFYERDPTAAQTTSAKPLLVCWPHCSFLHNPQTRRYGSL